MMGIHAYNHDALVLEIDDTGRWTFSSWDGPNAKGHARKFAELCPTSCILLTGGERLAFVGGREERRVGSKERRANVGRRKGMGDRRSWKHHSEDRRVHVEAPGAIGRRAGRSERRRSS
jgi:hypothetical protein